MGDFLPYCRRCNKRPAVIGRRTCDYCLSLASVRENRTQKFRQENNKCTYCGNDRDRKGVLCVKCADKSRGAIKAKHEKRMASGFCRVCGKEPFLTRPDGTRRSELCERCYLVNMAGKHLGSYLKWQILLDKLYRLDWRCFYTGEKLVMGENLSFDHLDPISRFPEKKNDATNIQPCSLAINLMKREMTMEEFIATCRVVANAAIMTSVA